MPQPCPFPEYAAPAAEPNDRLCRQIETQRERPLVGYTVFPLRFTSHVPAIVAFLEILGLREAVSTEGDGFAVLHGRSGRD
ncbi:MAG: hypothetical protein H0T91_05145 [Propionibacteriaceae bacterium]|nr:hypothetical protein [Propionibacteriaceae bacterium]